MLRLLATVSWPEFRHHPWRTATAVFAVALGVALALAVQLINASALAEFRDAVSAVNGQPDVELRARQGLLDDALLERVAAQPGVAAASPVLEVPAQVVNAQGERQAARLIGVDALSVGRVAPALMPLINDAGGRLDLFAPDAAFLNASARLAVGDAPTARLRLGPTEHTLRIAGHVNAPGAPVLVMDVAAAQALAARVGALSRIDLRLAPGATAERVLAAFDLPAGTLAQRPEQAGERVSNLSRAYRVNLTVLALVALFTGAFLVFSVLSLSVTRRQGPLALLGVLGLSARERLRLVLAESALLGLVGSALGVALGSAVAAFALRQLGGDLGGGYFTGVSPTLRWSPLAALLYGALGVAAALAGGWWPARAAQGLAPAQALKGLGTGAPGARRHGAALALLVLAGLSALAPPVAGVPLGAYVSVGLLLIGGIAALPLGVSALLDLLAPLSARHLLPLLAVERARRLRETAAVATSGVVASLALSVALTVMVASFRDSVTRWLDTVLPAPLYLRGSGAAMDSQHLPPAFVDAVAAVPGVARVDTLRAVPLQLDPARPPVALLVRPLRGDPLPLPLVGEAIAVAAPDIPVYVSEAMPDLYGARVGQPLPALAQALAAPEARRARYVVAGVWRDYARQHGSIAIDADTYARLSGERRVSDLALHLAPQADALAVREALTALARTHGIQDAIEFASVEQLRATSLRIFDRSFAVTVWLQAVAIGIGLFGVAASFSAQVLVRRKEFGLLAHLGLTRRQILGVVAAEGLAWTALGALAGTALGLLVSLVLVHVVNPQSFHWTMDLVLPWARLGALALAVVLAGTLTAWLAGRAAASRDAVQAVRQDW
ncbi:MAG: FtsX-like permease family protein [Hydrogenophaga sp.]|uniref:FtsX-like permease family protein n=1 Tax=Hydrogenophaga sp. TaxID=1904254 RepID=UPI00169C0755|nr:ABC transporter permease [Hydrogenophaga sp.]NIM41350.1 FtsX-like permease family protein [Hydrogenophaga sp.]NIN26666.1 FtsX-like permease family protein [Hydrogenophaga sp.]NIN29988.1 FtsX-like permease family protein [Hydrogenophaga sp.]NIN55596.1 FtsX-like permease family protein [Hydrogenophaga sp.]NIO52593.1 FtsX-like permease family protein [Hydrogenophaga sp.]